MTSLTQEFGLLDRMHALREEVLDALSDADLAFTLPGNPSLGAVCRAMGEVEYAYAESFKTWKMDFGYHHADKSVETSRAALRKWFGELDAALKSAMRGVSEADLAAGKVIDRGPFSPTPEVQFHIYREALLIFYGRVHVYLLALGKTPSEMWQAWIA